MYCTDPSPRVAVAAAPAPPPPENVTVGVSVYPAPAFVIRTSYTELSVFITTMATTLF